MHESIPDPVIDLRGVSKDYPLGRLKVRALCDVDLRVGHSQFVAVVGPSGSGKTTLLNLIGCIDHPTSGSVHVAGRDVKTMGDRELSRFRAVKLGFIFQTFNLIPVLTAYENVEYPLRLNRTPAGERRSRVMQMLGEVDLVPQARQRPNELSGGQRQRVAIARALVTRPEIVVADEPTANLDSETGAVIIELMRGMRDRFKTSFIIATHDPVVEEHARRHYHMRDGRLTDA